MRKTLITFILFASASASAVEGSYTSYLGYNAGGGASADFSVLLGAHSASGSYGLSKSQFLGVMSGSSASDLWYAAGIGFWALAETHSLSNVVGIGGSALRGTSNSAGVISIGSDFFKGGSGYTNVTAFGNVLLTSFGELYVTNDFDTFGYDLFVAEFGNDASNGTTLATAKRTLDGACAAVVSNGTRIAVLAGRYDYPLYFQGNKECLLSPEFVGVHGKRKTMIDGRMNDVPDHLHGNELAHPKWTGFTFAGLESVNTGFTSDYRTSALSMDFTDCHFSDIRYTLTGTASGFVDCILRDCEIDGVVIGEGGGAYGWGIFIAMSDLYGTTIKVRNPIRNNKYPILQWHSYFENCYVEAEAAQLYAYGSAGNTPTGNETAFYRCTVVIPTVNEHPSNMGHKIYSSIIGAGDIQGTVSADCYTDTAANVLSMLGSDHRPLADFPELAGIGYGSASEANTIDAIRAYVDTAAVTPAKVASVLNSHSFSAVAMTDSMTTGTNYVFRMEGGSLKLYMIYETNTVSQAESPQGGEQSGGNEEEEEDPEEEEP